MIINNKDLHLKGDITLAEMRIQSWMYLHAIIIVESPISNGLNKPKGES